MTTATALAAEPEVTTDYVNVIEEEVERDKLILKYLPLVKYVLGKISIYLPPHLDQDDLLEAGVLGLIDAAKKYDRSRDIKFKTYAIPRIRGSILDELRAQDWIPRSARKKASMLEGVYNKLYDRLQRSPTSEEVADEMGISLTELDSLLSELSFASLLSFETAELPSTDGEPHRVADFVENPRAEDPALAFEFEEEKMILAKAIAELPEQERLVITLYYFEDLLLKEIGEVMGLSESRISQVHSKAIFMLRAKVKRSLGISGRG